MQYECFERTKQMHFTPPFSLIYSELQGVREYWAEGETTKIKDI